MENSEDLRVLNSIYRGAKTGSQAISDLLPQVEESRLRADLTTQKGEYETIGADAANRMCALGGRPEEVPALKKAGMKLGVAMNTAMDVSSSHLAELMIRGSTMGVTNMTKVLNAYTPADRAISGLGNRLITAEQQNIDRLKVYL